MRRNQKPRGFRLFLSPLRNTASTARALRMRVAWSVVDGESFSVPFNLSARSQRLWITADKDGREHELHIKGTNWVCTCRARRQPDAPSLSCPSPPSGGFPGRWLCSRVVEVHC